VAFALGRSANTGDGAKKSPLAGWLGRKKSDSDLDLPERDVAGGLTRALRRAKVTGEKPALSEHENSAREALSTIEAALYGIDRIRDILEQACEVAISAKNVEDVGGRSLLAESYDELRLSINGAIEKTDDRAATLIGKGQHHIDVALGGKARYLISSMRLDITDKGLNLTPPRDAFSTYDEIDATLEQLDSALAKADRAAASYCRDAQYLIARMNGEYER